MGNNNSDLYLLVRESKGRNEASINELCQRFDPLLKRYSYILHNEDAYSDE